MGEHPETFDDETLMAFADGELDAARVSAVEAALAKDSALAARVERFTRSRGLVKQALGPLADEPLPDRLLARLETLTREHDRSEATSTGHVIPLPVGRGHRVALPLAASLLAAVLAGGAGYWLGWRAAPLSGGGMASLDAGAVHDALRTLETGSTANVPDGRLRVIASFRDASGALCREFELDRGRGTIVSVACAAASGWETRFAVVTPADGDYAPASSLEALDAYLAAIEAGTPLDPAAERAALDALPR